MDSKSRMLSLSRLYIEAGLDNADIDRGEWADDMLYWCDRLTVEFWHWIKDCKSPVYCVGPLPAWVGVALALAARKQGIQGLFHVRLDSVGREFDVRTLFAAK